MPANLGPLNVLKSINFAGGISAVFVYCDVESSNIISIPSAEVTVDSIGRLEESFTLLRGQDELSLESRPTTGPIIPVVTAPAGQDATTKLTSKIAQAYRWWKYPAFLLPNAFEFLPSGRRGVAVMPIAKLRSMAPLPATEFTFRVVVDIPVLPQRVTMLIGQASKWKSFYSGSEQGAVGLGINDGAITPDSYFDIYSPPADTHVVLNVSYNFETKELTVTEA